MATAAAILIGDNSHHQFFVSASSTNLVRYAWFAVALLVPVALLNYLDRQMLSTMKASMVGDIPSIANKADWGLVLGGFKWTYAILSPFAGYVADRIGKRPVIVASLFVWSLITWWTGHVTTFHELMVARAMMGVSEAFYRKRPIWTCSPASVRRTEGWISFGSAVRMDDKMS